jgi:hypothetical protein
MGERVLWYPDGWRTLDQMRSDPEVLAEMPTEALVEELVRRRVVDEGWITRCEDCNGSGVTPEHHEPWATEYLSCGECMGSGWGARGGRVMMGERLYVRCGCDQGNVYDSQGWADQCPACSSTLFRAASPAEVLAEMPTEALVEELLVRLAGREVWWCEVPEFNDPNCMTGMSLPAPGAAALPHKHSMCRWVWIMEKVEAER